MGGGILRKSWVDVKACSPFKSSLFYHPGDDLNMPVIVFLYRIPIALAASSARRSMEDKIIGRVI